MVVACFCTRTAPRFDEYACQQQIKNEFDFWQAAISFQKHKFTSNKQARKAARQIYNAFLKPDAPNAIALNKATLTKIQADLKQKVTSGNIYQEAILEISALLEQHFRTFVAKYKIKLSSLSDYKIPAVNSRSRK